MTTCSDPILITGRYQIVALILQGEDDLDQIIGYAVLTSAGVKLRHELTLDDAKAWMETRINQETLRSSSMRPRIKPARTRR